MKDIAPPELRPIGHVRSVLREPAAAPKQGVEGAPDAWIEFDPEFGRALRDLRPSDEILVLTWLHLANRTVLAVHPRDDPANPLTGVFATRSADRPNPIGVHRVTIHEVAEHALRVGPLEAVDGTPVVDVKPVLGPPDR